MAQKALLLNSLLVGFFLFLHLACQPAGKAKQDNLAYTPVAVAQIPSDTIEATNPDLKTENGVYFFKNKPFSGFIKKYYENRKLQFIGSFWQGKQHGISQSWYENGVLRDTRSYKENLAYGKHEGFWDNGKKKFAYFYINEKSHGKQCQWYRTGQPYMELHYENDSEVGMQKAWRENGKLFANYEAKDGKRYGLQKNALCYTLRDEKMKIK